MTNEFHVGDRRSRLAKGWIWILILSQPIMDVASYWANALELSSWLTLGVRMLILAITCLLAFLLAENKRSYWITAAVLIVVCALHMLFCARVGYADPVSDFTNFVRVAQLPIYTLCLITLVRLSGNDAALLDRALTCNLWLIAGITLLALLTGTNNPTYPDWEIGISGWFDLSNSQSPIYGVLTLVSVLYAIRENKPFAAIARCAVGFALLFFLGTRLAYAEIFAITLIVFLSMCITKTIDKRVLTAVCVFAIICGAAYRFGPMYQNRQAMANHTEVQQQEADEIITQTPPPPTEYDWLPDAQESIDMLYREYQPLMINRFGLEPVKAAFGYTDDVQKLGDLRLGKILFCRMVMNELPFTSRLFGFELAATHYEGEIFDVENDFHGIYFLYGIFGLVLMIAYLGVFAGRTLWRILRNPKQFLTLPICAYGSAAVILVINAYFSASVLRRPNASVYLSIALAVLWLLTEAKPAHDGKENQ